MDIDLNCDLGEGAAVDADLMPLVSSANICCGFHAGDAATVGRALEAARTCGTVVGAHPGFADPAHFGRRELDLSAEDIRRLILEQVAFLRKLADPLGVALRYLKPHGALYNMACRDDRYAVPVVETCRELDLPLVGLPDSRLQFRAQGLVPYFSEGFADRRYQADGTLVPRNRSDAVIEDVDEAVDQARHLAHSGRVRSLCVHGDNPAALNFARALRDRLEAAGWHIRPFLPVPPVSTS